MRTLGITPDASLPTQSRASDAAYAQLENLLAKRVANNPHTLFTTDVDRVELWEAYISSIPVHDQQYYTCNACRYFIQRYGGLVSIQENGDTHSLLWSIEDVPFFFRAAVRKMGALVRSARVTGVFLWDEKEWGQGEAGSWTHLHGRPAWEFGSRTQTAEQGMAEKREDFRMLSEALDAYPKQICAEAFALLDSDRLYRSEKARFQAHWLRGVYVRVGKKTGKARENLIWKEVSLAHPGQCHVRSSVLGSLLDDLMSGLPFASIARRWKEKLNPLQYQRPQAAPAAQTIQRAEKKVEQLGVQKALRRRSATLSDVSPYALWAPSPLPRTVTPKRMKRPVGVFSHLATNEPPARRQTPRTLPPQTVTARYFREKVLPGALQIAVKAPYRGAYYGLVTAALSTAPPILQWDGLPGHPRNPVSWYFRHKGSLAREWGLTANSWVQVRAIFPAPPHWQEPKRFSHFSEQLFFALYEAREYSNPGIVLFPETLKSELHEVRSVIEAHAKTAKLEKLGGDANGIAFGGSNPAPITLRVTHAHTVAEYTLDRWE